MNAAPPTILIIAMAVPALVLLFAAGTMVMAARPWIRALLSGVLISLVQIFGMRLRGVPPILVVDALAALVHRGHLYDANTFYLTQSTYLARREKIHSPSDLADLVEKEIPKA
jgi:uncharacterized protein YqfA (UPF0365 family)